MSDEKTVQFEIPAPPEGWGWLEWESSRPTSPVTSPVFMAGRKGGKR